MKAMKGISSIIASILILMIVITLAGSAYFLLSSFFTSRTAQSFSIIESYNDTITISNDGSVAINSLTATVDGQSVPIAVVPSISGLVGYWSFNEGSGSTTSDSSENRNHGTINGAVWTDGKFGKALSFDGVDDYVTFGDVNNFDGLSAITIAVWLYPREGDDGILSDDSFLMRYSGWASFLLYDNSGGNSGYIGQSATMNAWHLFTGIYDSSIAGNNMKLYVDGTLSSETHFSGTLASGGGSFVIAIQSGSADRFNGLIDDACIYNRALSESEIKQLYSGLVASGQMGTIKFLAQLTKGVHKVRLCTQSMCNAGYLTIL